MINYIKRSKASLKRVIDFERQLHGEDSLIRQTFGRSHLLPQEEMGFKDNEKLAALDSIDDKKADILGNYPLLDQAYISSLITTAKPNESLVEESGEFCQPAQSEDQPAIDVFRGKKGEDFFDILYGGITSSTYSQEEMQKL